MRRDKNFELFIEHFDWYTKDEKNYFIPTDKAPPEAVKAMEMVNKRMDWEKEQGAHY